MTQTLPPEEMSRELGNRLMRMQSVYAVLWSTFTGDYWRQIDSSTKQDRWKLKLNWTQAACFIHSALWSGDMPSNAEPVMRAHFEPRKTASGRVTEKAKAAADKVSSLVNEVWSENLGRAMMLDANTIAQALGGVVFAIRYEPERAWFQRHPLRIEVIRPDHFVAIANASNYYDLLKVWIVRRITMEEARLIYGYQPPPNLKQRDEVDMAELWTKDSYQITINGTVAIFNGKPMKGENPYGFIPVMYFPHIRAGQFEGIPLISQVLGLMEEINEASQTLGDMINNAVNELPYVHDAQGKLRTIDIAGRRYINLGSSQQFGTPKIERTEQPQALGELGPKYLSYLMATFKEIIMTPDVAWGMDPGSQRSGESRQLLFFPLEEHIKTERTFWGDGKNMMDEMIAQMLSMVPDGGYGLGADHKLLVKHQTWHPLLPPDREKLVTEMQLRAQAGHVSQETALERLGDVEDVEEEIQRIDAFMKKKEEWKPAALPGKDMPASPNGK